MTVTLAAKLSTLNSFPSVRFDQTYNYFMVPEIYVDVLKCGRRGLSDLIPS